MREFSVAKIDKRTAEAFVIAKHYSHRASIFWEAYALIEDGNIEGVVVYGQPSPPVQKYAFRNRTFRLYELCRLVIQTDSPNAASLLISHSLKQLERPSAVVSYADTEWGHAGIVYQATNWLYTGATRSHDHAYIIDGKRVHPMTLRDRGITDPKRWARENDIKTSPPAEKHRYFFLNGSRTDKKRMLKSLAYPVVKEYPKLDKQTYDAGPKLVVPFGVAP